MLSAQVSLSSAYITMEEVLLWSALTCCIVEKKRLERLKTRRSRWSRKWLLKRHNFSHIKLLRELRDEPNDWRNYLRMDIETYTHLLVVMVEADKVVVVEEEKVVVVEANKVVVVEKKVVVVKEEKVVVEEEEEE